MQFFRQHRHTRPVFILGMVLVGMALIGLLAPPPHLSAAPQNARLSVSISSSPAIYVVPGGTVSYHIQVRNYGTATASHAYVKLTSSPPMHVSLIGATFETNGDWISDIGSGTNRDTVTVTFSNIKPDTTRTATVEMEMSPTAPIGRKVDMWTSYSWNDLQGNSYERIGNAAPIIVGATNADSRYVWVEVTPLSGPVGTTHTVFSDRFVPGEEVYVWLRDERGSLPLPLKAPPVVSRTGAMKFSFQSTDLLPGTYQLVAQGSLSDLIGVVTFVVEP